MKQYYLYVMTLSVVLLTGCYKEDKLVPTLLSSVTDKFDFPQGTTPADEIFQRIYNKYGVKVIYKDFTERDLNRAWQSPVGGEISVGYMWNYLTDEQQLDSVATILEQKVFPLLPDTIIKAASRAYPYMYLVDQLYAPTNMVHFPIYPVNAFDGITVNLEATAGSDNYTYKVFFPLRIVLEYFMFAFNAGLIDNLPDAFYNSLGSVTAYYYVSKYRSETFPDQYDRYWARNGELPLVSASSGRITMGQYSGWFRGSALPPLTGIYIDVPYFFMYLSVDPHWREHFETGGAFEDCPRLKARLDVYYDHMKSFGIDFDKIQELLYDGTTVDTSIDRIFIRNVTSADVDQNTYIYYDINNFN